MLLSRAVDFSVDGDETSSLGFDGNKKSTLLARD